MTLELPRLVTGSVYGERLASMSEVVDAYQKTLVELDALKHERTRVARKLRAESQLRVWQV